MTSPIIARENTMDNQQATNARSVAVNANQVASADLPGSSKQVIIEHAGQHCQLCETRSGKLILTK